MKYRVELSGVIFMSGEVEIEADSIRQADEKALEYAHQYPEKVNWEPFTDFPEDESLQVEGVSAVETA